MYSCPKNFSHATWRSSWTPLPPYYTMMEEFDLHIIEDEDEAAAILDGDNTQDLPITIGSGNHDLPGTSQGVNNLTGNSSSKGVTGLPGTSPIDLDKDHGTPHNSNSPISSTREWDIVKRKTRKSGKTSNPAFEDIIKEPPKTKSHKGVEWVFLTISTAAVPSP